MERIFAAPQNWTLYDSISFGFFGTNSGATIRDTFQGWRTFSLPGSIFVRRSDWQPANAPNDGFNRNAVWGFNISPIHGQGSFQSDEIKLINP